MRTGTKSAIELHTKLGVLAVAIFLDDNREATRGNWMLTVKGLFNNRNMPVFFKNEYVGYNRKNGRLIRLEIKYL